MNKKFKIALITIAITVVLVVAAVLIASLIKPDMPAKQTSLPSADVSGTAVTDVPEETPEPSPEHVNTVTSTLAVGGDIVMHTGLNGEAMTDTGYDYVPIFGILKDFIANADYSVCSLVTTLGGGGKRGGGEECRAERLCQDAVMSHSYLSPLGI